MSLRTRMAEKWLVPGLYLLGLVVVAGAMFLPAAVSFPGAVAAACGWCMWLERHSDPFAE